MTENNKAVLTSWSIRKKLLLLLLLIFLPAFGIILASGLKQRRDEIDKAKNNALLLGQSLAAQQEQIANSTKVLLRALEQLPALQHRDAEACNKIFTELNQLFPLHTSVLAATTPDGNVFAASKPFMPGMVNLSDRKYLREAIANRDFSVGEYMTGRLSGRQSLNYAYPVHDATRNLIAVTIAGFDLSEYARLVSQVKVPAGYSVTIADWKGIRLFRSPEDGAAAVGAPLTEASMKLISGGAEEGFFEERSGDGQDRIYAFRKVRLAENSQPYMYILVGAPKSQILGQANVQVLANLFMLGVAALAAMCLAWAFGEYVFLNPIRRLLRATQQLGKGEMNIHTELRHSSDELGQLAKSFDGMAALLEMRNSERQRAEDALSQANAELELRVRERTAELSALNQALTLEVAERKHAEQQLTESRRRLQAAMDAAQLGVWARALATGELVCDERARTIIGAEAEAGITYEELLSRVAEDRDSFRDLFEGRCEEQAGNINVEYRIQSPGRGTRWVHLCGSVMRDSSGTPQRVTGIVMDITARKRAEQEMRSLEEQFRHSQKMEAVGRLAGGIAHDFNNLLQVINGHSELIADAAGPDSPVARQANAIHQAGLRAAQLTSHLLAFSRHQVAETKIFEIDQAVSGFEKIVRRVIPEDIELRTRLKAGQACAKIAPVQLEQVIMNLVVNARDAMAAGGRLTIATSCEKLDGTASRKGGGLTPGDYVVLSVTDSGHGIELALRDRVFEPFFTTKPLGKGTGLGLSTVYGILRQSGGGVHVRSKPEKGSMFKVYLPLCGEAVREKVQAPLAPPPAGLETVLLAEDEGAVRTLLHEHLQELGYRVLEAANGMQALEIARQHINQIDIVVTDVVMPKMGGRELSAQLRLLRPEIKIVLMTGYTEATVCDELRAAGLELLAKPFSRRALAGKLREMLDSHQPARPAAAETLPISENRIV